MRMKLMQNKGFTLVELLVVMAILGILVTIVAGGFISSQIRGRDGQRKSDLKQISNALELYYNDYGVYPAASGGNILGCPTTTSTTCTWGSTTNAFTDGKTTYLKIIPKDPVSNRWYYYRVVDSPTNKKYQIFGRLENTQDPSIASVNASATCGSGITCNFAVTSANTNSTEQ